MIKAVFFDAIDTLFEPWPDKIGQHINMVKRAAGITVSRETMERAWTKLLEETEEASTTEIGRRGWGSSAWSGFNERLLRELNYQGDCKEAGNKLLYEVWGNSENYHLYEDVIPTLKMLKDKNILIACVSNEDGYLDSFFDRFDIRKYFSFIMTSEEVGIEKPDPEIFKIALDKAGMTAEEVIFVGDSLISDYQGSLEVGMRPLLIDRKKRITDNKIQTIRNLKEIEKYL